MKKLILAPLAILLLSSCNFVGTSSFLDSSSFINESSLNISSEPHIPLPNSEESIEDSSEVSSLEIHYLDNIDYIKFYSSHNYNYIYMWKDGVYPCGEWPGKKMNDYDDNWVTYDLKNNQSMNVVFHDNKGNQSSDLFVNGNGHYFYMDGIISKRDVLPASKEESSEQKEYQLPDNKDAYRNFYQLLVYSFADSNNDGVGDFKGIANKLGYLKELGIESIWLSPINACSSYHAYDVTDYYKVNPLYEVNGYTINSLIEDAHKEGIQIVLDLVLNHTSYNHPWVQEHPSWYGSDDKFGMPEFNFDNKEVRTAIKNVGLYWLDQNVDGFRLDAAMWVYNNGVNRHKKNYEWWNEWCDAMREKKNDVYIVAEVLDSNHDLAYDYAQAGFNSTFDFDAMKHVYNAVKSSTYDYASKTIADIAKARKYNPNYCLARPLSNHDIGRFSDEHNDMGDASAYYLSDYDDLILANALNILTPGNTYIYYGDELGMTGTCPQGWDDMKSRTPMPFKTGRTNSVKYFNGFKGNGITTSLTLSGNSAEEDQASNSSIYFFMKKLLNIKIDHPTIKNGTLNKFTTALPEGLNGYTINGEENIAVVYNSSSSSIKYSFDGHILYSRYQDVLTNISIPSKGWIVYTY